MPNYYVNTDSQPAGEHEVHTTECGHGPAAAKRKPLGWYASCSLAIEAAKRLYTQVDGCKFCSKECHKR